MEQERQDVVTTTTKENGVGEPEAEGSPLPTKIQLTKEDMLRLENYSLKSSNLRLQQERLQADIVKCAGLLQDLAREVTVFQTGLNGKYGVDIAKGQLLADGSWTPTPPGKS